MRVIFMGTPDFALAPLAEIFGRGHEIAAVYTRAPKAAGRRGLELTPSPVHAAAERYGLTVLTPKSFRDPETIEQFRAFEADVAVVVAYGLILPKLALDAPAFGCLNLHGSLLPRWRGAAPLQRAIMAGDRETGVTIHRTVKELDAGPIAAQAAFVVEEDADAGAVFVRAAELAVELLDGVLAKDEPRFEPQPSEGVTYAEKIAPADRELDLADPEQAVRVVRALSPHIGARATLDGREVIVWRARADDGRFVPLEVQPAGKRRMTYDEFRRGLR
jgi:methionyl-tRNA formyltransferase